MPHEIVIVGGGPAGLLTANLLAKRLRSDEAHITLVDDTGRHVYRPGFTAVALGEADTRSLTRDIRKLLRDPVDLVVDRAVRLDPVAGTLHLRHARPLRYDTAVLATGARLDRRAVPGLTAGSHDFYSMEGATRLREALRGWEGGRLVVGIAGMPYSCPPAPVEFTLLVHDLLTKRGVRDRTDLVFLSPINRAIAIESVNPMVEELLADRSVTVHTLVNIDEVDPQAKKLHSMEGETFDYDLAVLVPPHAGAAIVADSGLGDGGGWLPTDPGSLKVRGFDNVYGQGDSTDMVISKSGSTAHFESPVIVEQIVSAIRGIPADPKRSTFDGAVICLFETGRGKATMLRFDYDRDPEPRRPSRLVHLGARLFHRAYWWGIPQGRFTR